ncbi:hypothetical protein GCM10010123_21490 [Pilimelia anulata]|uniref:Uncharacterized protein n=1 Tax=Pilimelia anulata TaxID=53371 RepID=A0A8J3F7W9_9ACTN|nr:hypothetical protein [Pilimelia anulata]GGJ91377.1 hypothetical protein GCM10010123_21490 [Pilimelia anulata]
MSHESKNRIPNPLYAAAGAGDLAFQQLRKHLPAAVDQLRGRATTLRERATAGEFDKLRSDARSALYQATEKAGEIYRDLVVRGERVVGHATEPAEPARGVATVPAATRPAGKPAARKPRKTVPPPAAADTGGAGARKPGLTAHKAAPAPEPRDGSGPEPHRDGPDNRS